jgi:3-oxoacyl-[acyl-carrier protein] reductase
VNAPDRMHTIVVGGTRGIGRAITRELSRQGHNVTSIGRRDPSADDLKFPNVRHWSVDMSESTAADVVLNEIVAARGTPTNLVFSQRYRGDDDPWEGEIGVGLDITRQVVDFCAMPQHIATLKSIVAIASVAAGSILEEQHVGYHVAKAGLVHMMRHYAVTLGPQGVRANAVSPATTLKEESQNYFLNDAETMRFYEQLIPLRRMGNADDVANVVAFLCSDQSSFMTGQDLVVDGGVSLQNQETVARKATQLPARPSRT